MAKLTKMPWLVYFIIFIGILNAFPRFGFLIVLIFIGGIYFYTTNRDFKQQVITIWQNIKGKTSSSTPKAEPTTTTNSNSKPMETFQAATRKGKRFMIGLIILIAVIVLLINMIIVVPVGHTGVYSLFGKVRETELQSGIHLVNPLASITFMSIRTEEYTMSVATGEGKRVGDDSITALTKEGLSIGLDVTILYRLIEADASEVYRELGLNYDEKIIRPIIRSSIREVVSVYEAKDIYAEKREEVADKLLEKLSKHIETRGIVIENVLLRNVHLPNKLAQSIEEKLSAEQESQRYDFVLEKESKEAERKRIEAKGQKDAQEIISQSLTDRYLQYLYVNGIKDRAGTIYVPVGQNGLPLFYNINQ